MVVIIEGLDGVGKTTLCNELSHKIVFEYIKGSYISSNLEKKQRMVDLLSRILDDSTIYIYDRITLIDDFVYSFLNKGETVLDKYIDIIKCLLNRCLIIHLDINEEVRRKRFDLRGDDYVNNDVLLLAKEEYERYYKYMDLNVKHIHLDSNNLEANVLKIYNTIINYGDQSYSK